MPGRHHSKAHYTRVWNDEPGAEQSWLEGYDAIDRLRQTSEMGGSISEHSWVGPGFRRLLERVHGNGTALTYLSDAGDELIGYDPWKRVTRLRHSMGGTFPVDRGYSYDRMDHRTSESRLEDAGLGVPVGPDPAHVVPVVPAAVIFDLGRGGRFGNRRKQEVAPPPMGQLAEFFGRLGF